MATYNTKDLARDFTDTSDARTGYLMGHSPQEAERLDAQHVFLRHAVDDRLISPQLEPAVRTGKIRRVLDVATGTGIWCAELVEELRSMGVTQPISVLGVDIAENEHWNRYYSSKNHARITFEKADMHDDNAMTALVDKHGTFDLVNIRWVAVAVKKT